MGHPSRSLSVSSSPSRLPSVDRAIVVMRNVRGSAVAWQIPRCGSPAFRSWPRGRQQLALRGRPRLCAARPVEPAGPPSPARLVYGCSAGKQPRVIRIYSAADLGRRRAQVLERGAHTSGRSSRRTAPRDSRACERLVGRTSLRPFRLNVHAGMLRESVARSTRRPSGRPISRKRRRLRGRQSVRN